MCPLHLFWPPQRSCCYYYCLWSPGPIFIIIIWLFTLYSHLSHLSFNQFHWIWILIQLMCPLHLFWPPQRSCCYYYCLWSPGPIFIIIIWLFTLYSHLSHLSFNNSLNLDFNPTYVSTSHLFLAAAKICCYCLSSPGPIFIIIIWLFILYSHLSYLSFNNFIEFGF